ncbi:MAG: DUF2079 domain-containing protein [Patescibacteria group bacterium]|jgi:uncharacterized membrane protein
MKKESLINHFITKKSRWVIILAIIFYLVLFGFISLWKYYNFGYNALDLAIINQVFYNSSQGNFFASSIHPPTYLGDHFSPILFLLLPFYWLWRSPQILLIFQTLILAACSWPLYLITKKVLGQSWALGLVLIWLLNPFVQNINLFEFHFLALGIFFIFWAFYFYQNKNLFAYLLICLLALMVREDLALVIILFGLVAFLEKRGWRWWLVTILLSGLYFIAALKITSFFAPGEQYKFLIYYSWLGQTPAQALNHLVFQPWLVIQQLFRFNNIIFTLALFLPWVFLPLINPFYLLLGLGIFLQLTLGSGGGSTTILDTYYSSLLLPPIFIAAIYSLKKIIDNKSDISQKIQNYRGLVGLIFVTGIIYSTLTLGPIVGSLNKIFQTGLISPTSQSKKEFIEKIPPDAAVATTYDFLAPLSSRTNLYSFNYIFLGKQQFLTKDYALPDDTKYLLIDYNDFITYQLQYGKNLFYQAQYQKAAKNWPKTLLGFGLVEIKDSLALYQKGVADKFSLVEVLPEIPAGLKTKNLVITPEIKFIGFKKIDMQYQLFWEINLPLTKDYQLNLSLGGDGITETKTYPFAYNLLQTDNLGGQTIIQTNYWPDFIKKVPSGTYNLKIDLSEIQAGGIEVDQIRSTKNVVDREKLIGEVLIGPINL